MIALASASLGLVAALAWNEAIKATLAQLGLSDELVGLYTYCGAGDGARDPRPRPAR